MNLELLNTVKRLVIIALASDDELIESLVLKGGNAIDLVYKPKGDVMSRASYDLDYSLDEDFGENLEEVKMRIEKTLSTTFSEHGFKMFDYKFYEKPEKMSDALSKFWGGYKIDFKVIQAVKVAGSKEDINEMRKFAVPVKPNHSPTFEIEISKFEFIGEKKEVNVDGYTVYVYTPEMLVFEKVRAICQQIPEYKEIVPSHNPRARARDFYDIYLIMDQHQIDPATPESKELITNIFSAKKVPTEFIQRIKDNKSIHVDDWISVKQRECCKKCVSKKLTNFKTDKYGKSRKTTV